MPGPRRRRRVSRAPGRGSPTSSGATPAAVSVRVAASEVVDHRSAWNSVGRFRGVRGAGRSRGSSLPWEAKKLSAGTTRVGWPVPAPGKAGSTPSTTMRTGTFRVSTVTAEPASRPRAPTSPTSRPGTPFETPSRRVAAATSASRAARAGSTDRPAATGPSAEPHEAASARRSGSTMSSCTDSSLVATVVRVRHTIAWPAGSAGIRATGTSWTRRGVPSSGSTACTGAVGSRRHDEPTRCTVSAPTSTATRSSTVSWREDSEASEKTSTASPVAATVVVASRPRSGDRSRRPVSQAATVRSVGRRGEGLVRRRAAKKSREPTAARAANTSGGTSRSSGPSAVPADGGRDTRPAVAEAAVTTRTTTHGTERSGRPSRRRLSIRVATPATTPATPRAATTEPAHHRAEATSAACEGALEPTAAVTSPRATIHPTTPPRAAAGSSSTTWRSPAETGRRPTPGGQPDLAATSSHRGGRRRGDEDEGHPDAEPAGDGRAPLGRRGQLGGAPVESLDPAGEGGPQGHRAGGEVRTGGERAAQRGDGGRGAVELREAVAGQGQPALCRPQQLVVDGVGRAQPSSRGRRRRGAPAASRAARPRGTPRPTGRPTIAAPAAPAASGRRAPRRRSPRPSWWRWGRPAARTGAR